MQLRVVSMAFLMLCCYMGTNAQVEESDSAKIKLEDIEVNFLMSYYKQDGNHSPVTGGTGTELLTNIAPNINVVVPVDSVRSWNFDGGVDFYSSASSDNINNPYLDPNHVSGASASDARGYVTITRKKKKGNVTKSVVGGGSMEWDVLSFSGGGSWGVDSKDKNRSFEAKARYYFDDWKRVYPIEFRNGIKEYLPTDKRHSVNSSFMLTQNLTKRLNALVATDLVWQQGILSTPFHRVYFWNQTLPEIEKLPGIRYKVPMGIRLNYHATGSVIFRSFYRYYLDSWGVQGHTVELTMPIKLHQTFRLYPFYRYHQQRGARYFAGYNLHTRGESDYYTSDFDLSTFTSHKYGVGISYTPLFGLGRFKYGRDRNKLVVLKAVKLRYAYYERSDGLRAGVVTFGLQMNVKR